MSAHDLPMVGSGRRPVGTARAVAGTPDCSGGDGLLVSIVKGWVALAGHSIGRVNVVGKSVAGLSEPVHLIVQTLEP